MTRVRLKRALMAAFFHGFIPAWFVTAMFRMFKLRSL